MISAQNLGEKISRMFNFVYNVNGEWYVLGRDYFQPCTDNQLGVYNMFCKALETGDREEIISQYRRVRKYTSDCQPNDEERDIKIVQFVNGLDDDELISLNNQVIIAEKLATDVY